MNQKVNAVERNSVNTVVRNEVYAVKTAQVKEIADLKKRVKKLERKRRSRTPRMNLFKIGISRRRSLGEDDASKQGRNLKQRQTQVNNGLGPHEILIFLIYLETAQVKEIADLKKRVKKLERKRRSRTPRMNLFKIGISRRRSLGEDDASKQGRNLKQRSIFEESDFDVQAIMDADYELAARLKAE
nr:hypothetical protein [Tanacetum cinerariifolium]